MYIIFEKISFFRSEYIILYKISFLQKNQTKKEVWEFKKLE
jgi:hypothetical protein